MLADGKIYHKYKHVDSSIPIDIDVHLVIDNDNLVTTFCTGIDTSTKPNSLPVSEDDWFTSAV